MMFSDIVRRHSSEKCNSKKHATAHIYRVHLSLTPIYTPIYKMYTPIINDNHAMLQYDTPQKHAPAYIYSENLSLTPIYTPVIKMYTPIIHNTFALL